MLQINEKYPLEKTLNWEIQERPIFNQEGQQINGFKEIINDQTKKVIEIQHSTYTPTYNNRLLETCEHFTANTGFSLSGFATYNGGAKVMAYLKNENAPKFGGLAAKDYLIIGNSHDGSSAFFTGMTNVIYRCQNMFTQHHRQNRIRHTLNHELELKAMEQTHDLYYNHLTGIYQTADQMRETAINHQLQEQCINEVLQINENNELSSYTKNVKEKLQSAIFEETQVLGNNLFGLFNGVTNYTSNIMKQRKPIFGNPFNLANTLNQRAYEFCKVELEKKPQKTQLIMPEPLF